ncbi:response regulator [Pseudomonas mohnii]
MNILIIEDNPLKRDKVVEFLSSRASLRITEAASYNSGLLAVYEQSFDLLIVDMSMPTFDRNENTQGGRFRALAGKEIVTKLSKANKLVPFVVITGYKDFSVDSQSLSIDQIHDLLKTLGESYLGCIVFETTDDVWQEKLNSVLEKLGC